MFHFGKMEMARGWNVTPCLVLFCTSWDYICTYRTPWDLGRGNCGQGGIRFLPFRWNVVVAQHQEELRYADQ